MRLNFLVLLLTASLSVSYEHAYSATTAEAFSQGADFAKGSIEGNRDRINGTNASGSIPNYTATDSASGYYADGKGSLNAPAAGDVASCTGSTSDANRHTNGKCESVRMIMNDPGKKSAMFPLDKTKDPLFVERNRVKNDPDSYLGSFSPSGSYAGCVEKVINEPDIYSEELCNQYLNREDATCFETLNVTVVKNDSCVPGTWFRAANTGRDGLGPGHFDQVYARVRCDMTSPGQKMTLQIYAAGYVGACVGWQSLDIDPLVVVSSPIPAPSLSPHWQERCRTMITNYTHNGCPGNNCVTSFNYYTSEESCPNGEGIYGCNPYCPNDSNPMYTIAGCQCRGGSACVTSKVRVNTLRASLSLNYEKPHTNISYIDSWDDQCAAFRARLP